MPLLLPATCRLIMILVADPVAPSQPHSGNRKLNRKKNPMSGWESDTFRIKVTSLLNIYFYSTLGMGVQANTVPIFLWENIPGQISVWLQHMTFWWSLERSRFTWIHGTTMALTWGASEEEEKLSCMVASTRLPLFGASSPPPTSRKNCLLKNDLKVWKKVLDSESYNIRYLIKE